MDGVNVEEKRSTLLAEESDSEPEQALNSKESVLNINKEYAKRFEHNKAREELQRLQERYGDGDDDDATSSSSESEDDEGVLATELLDAEISATLQAIRSKDPRIYDGHTKFYSEFDPETAASAPEKTKPVYLRDYHRNALLEGHANGGEDEKLDDLPTYASEQERLKQSLVSEMHASAEQAADDSDSDAEDDDLLVPKRKSKPENTNGHSNRKAANMTLSIEDADKDPDAFLDKYMASRAWIPAREARFQPFESEDSDEADRADQIEEAYNLRFENPEISNQRLTTHARDTAAKYSVRREGETGRKRAREAKKAQKAAEKKEREADLSRLKSLKTRELGNKLEDLKEAARFHGKKVTLEQLGEILDNDWGSDDWDAEMAKHFDEDYYNADTEDTSTAHKRRKLEHPKWDDDLSINDIVPDFSGAGPAAEEELEEEEGSDTHQNSGDAPPHPTDQPANDAVSLRERKRSARKERQLLEAIAEQKLNSTFAEESQLKGQSMRFRFRSASPTSFGLTTLDIVNAEDADLNEFAGMKKLGSYRDAERKRKDKRRLGKKARLREWRKDVFGDREQLATYEVPAEAGPAKELTDTRVSKGKKKRRQKKKKTVDSETA